MKRFLCICLSALFLFSVAACSSAPSTEPSTDYSAEISSTAKDGIDGFFLYENEEAGFRVQYPDFWVEISKKTTSNPEVIQKAKDYLEINEAGLSEMLSVLDVCFLDMERSSSSFGANMNVARNPNGIDAGDFSHSLTDLEKSKLQMEESYGEMFSDFAWDKEPMAREEGEHTYLFFSILSKIGESDVVFYIAMIENNDRVYTFTYVSKAEDATADLETVLGQFLGSVEFI